MNNPWEVSYNRDKEVILVYEDRKLVFKPYSIINLIACLESKRWVNVGVFDNRALVHLKGNRIVVNSLDTKYKDILWFPLEHRDKLIAALEPFQQEN